MNEIKPVEAKALVKTYGLIQEYIGEIQEIASSSPVGYTKEAERMQKRLQSMYDDDNFRACMDKLEAVSKSKK